MTPDELQADKAYYGQNAQGLSSQVRESEATLRFQRKQTTDQIAQAESMLASTQAQVVAAAADVENTRLTHTRTQDLAKKGVASLQEADQARTAFEAAQAKLDSLKRQVEAQRATVALARSNAEQIAMRRSQVETNQHMQAAAAAQHAKADVRLHYTEITAPTDGIVDVRAARAGEYVAAGQPIVTLINPDDLWIRADVEETYIDRVRLGDKFTVRLPSGLEREGTVFYRGVDASFATQRDVSRTKRDIKTFEVRLRVDNADRRLALGMTAYVLSASRLMATGSMNAIDVKQIVKKFGDFVAVNGISFAVEEGEIFGLLGPNGAGKSTLIRMLTTLLPPTSGTALVHGFDVIGQADGVRRSIGVIPQAMTSDLELSVEENLIIFAKLYGVPRAKREKLIDQLLEAVQLTEWRAAQVKNLSGGMRRRVEIARGLVHEPRIFFLDEPTTGLDPGLARRASGRCSGRIKSERDLTVLLTTHYMDEADKLCDRIAIVDHGELKALDSPLKLKASIPGKNTLEVSFSDTPASWVERLSRLPEVDGVAGEDHIFRITTRNGPATTLALMEAAARAHITVQSLSVQSTTLDDVFVHYTGRGLRDALQEASAKDSPFMLRRN